MSIFTVSDLARKWSVPVWRVSSLIYKTGWNEKIPVVSGRRLIQAEIVPALEIDARRAGILPPLNIAGGGK